MASGSESDPVPGSADPASAPAPEAEPGRPPASPLRRWGWRFAAPLAFAVSGGLFVASAHGSQGTDLRPSRYIDLASLVRNESRQVTDLNDRVAQLQGQVDQLTNSVDNREVRKLQQRAEALRGPAGLNPVTGDGISVTLSDAPADVINSTTQDIRLLIVHQQDIQAVVNAMWRAGAVGVTVQGQRLVSTTGIKCAWNVVQLDGVPYAQPYTIVGIGDPTELLRAIEEDDYLANYREQAQRPDIAVGWSLEPVFDTTLPGYEGLTDLTSAEVTRG